MSPRCSANPKKSSSFNWIHCFLMLSNRDKRGAAHTWTQCRHVSIHQLPAMNVFISALAPSRKQKQEVHSPPTISKQHLQWSLHSERPGAVPQSNQWHLSALWKKPIMGWGRTGSEGGQGGVSAPKYLVSVCFVSREIEHIRVQLDD